MELWVRRWVWIDGSVYRGSGGGMDLDQWRLVGFSVEIGGFGSVEIGGFLGGDWGFLGGMGSSRFELMV